MSYYKNCIVPQCLSTSLLTPTKLFIRVPNNAKMRRKWLKLARRADAHCLSITSRMYFCEDHFDLPNDMLNYTEYHIMKQVSYVRMKPGCLPSKFGCQEDRRKRTCTSAERPYMIKKQRMTIIAECLNELQESCTPSTSNELQESCTPSTSNELQESCTPSTSNDLQESCTPSTSLEQQPQTSSSGFQIIEENRPEVISKPTADKSIQVIITHKYRSKATQTKIKTIDKATSPLKPSTTSSFTSPFKVKTCKKSRPSSSTLDKITRNILISEEQSDSDVSLYAPSVSTNTSSPAMHLHTSQVKSSSDCSEFIAEDRKIEASENIIRTINKIEKQPRSYIGVPKNCYDLIDIIKDKLDIPKHHILLCLNKIRLDCTFNILAHDFGSTSSSLSKAFIKNVPLIASVLRPFIVPLDKDIIKMTLPMAFRHKYHMVSCIIDCLEIEIQKPSKAVNQAMTWSEYKKANTIKYLISCTPNGLVNYVSPGFGGRTTDTCVVESCDFIKSLKSGMCIMADRGFKHIEQYLRKSGITLVRPPSVEKGAKLSKTEAKETKQIASLRVHVERVIRRLREFYMLKPHACLNFKFVKILDDIIIIACALINLQDSLIK